MAGYNLSTLRLEKIGSFDCKDIQHMTALEDLYLDADSVENNQILSELPLVKLHIKKLDNVKVVGEKLK